MADLLEVVVPVRWSGAPFADGSIALAWLGADGFELPGAAGEPPAGALRLRFRTAMRMGDRAQFERALDDATGGPENTNDLEVAYHALQAKIQVRYETRLWPDGRPAAQSDDEAAAQSRQIDRELLGDLLRLEDYDETDEDREARTDAATFDRVAQQRQLCRDMAEMMVLCEGPAEWKRLAEREWEDPGHIDACVQAWRHAKAERARTRGNARRSAA